MPVATFAEARPRIRPLQSTGVRCPRCLNEAVGWLLQRPDNCGKGPNSCIRQPETIRSLRTDADLYRLMRALGVRWPKRRAVPTYPATMEQWQKDEADIYLDAMSAAFVGSFGSKGAA